MCRPIPAYYLTTYNEAIKAYKRCNLKDPESLPFKTSLRKKVNILAIEVFQFLYKVFLPFIYIKEFFESVFCSSYRRKNRDVKITHIQLGKHQALGTLYQKLNKKLTSLRNNFKSAPSTEKRTISLLEAKIQVLALDILGATTFEPTPNKYELHLRITSLNELSNIHILKFKITRDSYHLFKALKYTSMLFNLIKKNPFSNRNILNLIKINTFLPEGFEVQRNENADSTSLNLNTSVIYDDSETAIEETSNLQPLAIKNIVKVKLKALRTLIKHSRSVKRGRGKSSRSNYSPKDKYQKKVIRVFYKEMFSQQQQRP